jgi:CRP-like cAMP-binding protein
MSSFEETLMKTDTEIQVEPMATRVALHPFLAGMNRKQLAYLTDCAIAVQFKEGEVVFGEGELANRFYLLETGTVILESNGGMSDPVIIDTIGAGDLLGWSWMFPPYTWHFTARSLTLTTAIFFYGTILREYCERDHSLGYELLKRMSAVMTRRMQSARDKMLAVHHRSEILPPVGLPPFMEQEFDTHPGAIGDVELCDRTV